MPGPSRAGAPSPHARRVRRVDAAFTWTLWIAVAATIAILMLIVLSIISRGLISDTIVESPFLGARTASAALSTGAGDITIIINRGIRVSALTAEDVEGLFGGAMSNWGDLSGQDREVQVFFPDHSSPRPGEAKSVLLGEGRAWAESAVSLSTVGAVCARVAAGEGGIGWIPSADLPPGGVEGARVVPVRRLAALVNPSVIALAHARRLTAVTETQLRLLLAGEVTNWREVGGPDLPVRLVNLGPDSWERKQLSLFLPGGAWTVPPGARQVGDVQTLNAVVSATPGALAICGWRDAAPGRFLEVRAREVKRNLTLSYIVEQPRRAGKVGGVSTIILNTVFMIALTLLFITPIGVGAALYLTEYTRQGRLVSILRFASETLAGIPSIIFGLFGFIVFVTILRLGIGLLSGTLTLTIMLLPTIIRTSEEAIRGVPVSLRAGSLALGATKWQTTIRVVVPAASPGILTGVILAIGRAVGETAALLFTMGTDYRLVTGLRSSARGLSVHLFYLLKEGISFDRAFATGTILVVIVVIVNLATTRLIGRMNLMRAAGVRNGKAA